jgi:hypothetical protein
LSEDGGDKRSGFFDAANMVVPVLAGAKETLLHHDNHDDQDYIIYHEAAFPRTDF